VGRVNNSSKQEHTFVSSQWVDCAPVMFRVSEDQSKILVTRRVAVQPRAVVSTTSASQGIVGNEPSRFTGPPSPSLFDMRAIVFRATRSFHRPIIAVADSVVCAQRHNCRSVSYLMSACRAGCCVYHWDAHPANPVVSVSEPLPCTLITPPTYHHCSELYR
jgi:hypothetical protein